MLYYLNFLNFYLTTYSDIYSLSTGAAILPKKSVVKPEETWKVILVFQMMSGFSLTNFHGMMLKKPVTTNGKVDTGPNTESTILAKLKILSTNWWKKEVWFSFKVWPSMMSLMKKSFVYMRKGKVFLSMHASKYYSKSIHFCDIYLPKCWDDLKVS